jgi:hypothetical protein
MLGIIQINNEEVRISKPKIMIVDDIVFNVDCLEDIMHHVFNIEV